MSGWNDVFAEYRKVDGREIVDCDENCGAFVEPETLEEYKAALKHWMSHGNLAGCAHGC